MLKSVHFAVSAALLSIAVPGPNLMAQGQADALRRAVDARPMPGDKIYLHILREPLLSDTVTVDERGEAAFPKLGTINVGMLSIVALSDSLRARYKEYLQTPELEIVVLRRVIVNGEVARPNVYLVPVSSTVTDVIARAGGFTDAAKRGTIHVVRDGQRTRIANWESGAAVATALLSGDVLIVSRKSWWALNALPATSTALFFASIVIAAQR